MTKPLRNVPDRHGAMYLAARDALYGDQGSDRGRIALAIADAIEVGLRRAGFDDDPSKRTAGRCDTPHGHPGHIWWVEPPTRPTDEASWCDGLPIEPPSERQLVQRYVDAGEPDDSSWGVASHEWDDRIGRDE